MNDKQKKIVLDVLNDVSEKVKIDNIFKAIFIVEHIQTDEHKEKGISPR